MPVPAPPKKLRPPTPIEVIAIEEATRLLESGHLFTPHEAMATARRDRGAVQTLYSVARTIADQENGDWETILARLEDQFPSLC